MSDGYLVIRKSTLACVVERARDRSGLEDLPHSAVVDLGEALPEVEAPEIDEERLRAAGPILSDREHVELLAADPDLDLPTRGQAAEFWQTVARVTLTVLRNEAEAVRRIIAARSER